MNSKIERSRLPAEWEEHSACWLAFPYRQDQWSDYLEEAQAEHIACCRAIAEQGGEPVRLLVNDAYVRDRARELLGNHPNIELLVLPYGDSWTRDFLPSFALNDENALISTLFDFNGWGGKYVMEGDDSAGQKVAELTESAVYRYGFVGEGGAIDSNGAGALLVSESCLLRDDRNPNTARSFMNERFAEVGIRDVYWIEGALQNDHTDGHIDTIARFVNESTVVCTQPEPDHPNADALRRIERQLQASPFTVLTLPCPEARYDDEGNIFPSSYTNFYIANRAVIVPQYGGAHDEEALSVLRSCFPDRSVVGVSAKHIIRGGGAVHCITQQQPVSRP
ncbi:MAG: agmatine deiminase family protein [Polyangiales bacterium]